MDRLRSDFLFDDDYVSGQVPLDQNHLISDYENQRLQIATAAGAGELNFKKYKNRVLVRIFYF